MPRLCRCGLCYFSISCCILFTGLLPAWGQFPGGFSKVHFDGTFVILGHHILDTSDIGVLLQETNPNFQNLSKSNAKDISWDSDGVRYTADSKDLKITWVLDPAFFHYTDGHPTHVFQGTFSLFEIEWAHGKGLLASRSSSAFRPSPPDWPLGSSANSRREPRAAASRTLRRCCVTSNRRRR